MLYKEVVLPYAKHTSKISGLVFDVILYASAAMVLLGCANVFGMQGTFMLVALLLSGIFIALKGHIVINWPFLLSIAFFLLYSASAYAFSKETLSTTVFYSAMIVVLIQLFEVADDKKRLLNVFLLSYIFGLYISFLLMVLSTYWQQGITFSGDIVNNFWTDTSVARTGISLYEIGALGVFFALLFFKNRFRRWFFVPILIANIVFSSLISLLVGNRSFIVAIAILVLAILFHKSTYSERTNHTWTILLFVYMFLLGGLLLLIILHQAKFITIPEKWMDIKIIERIFNNDLTQGRPELLKEFFAKFQNYPFGGLQNDMRNKYVHNIFLDFYTYGGIPSFSISTLFFVFLVIYVNRFYDMKEDESIASGLFSCITCAIIGLGLVEPIYQANPNCVMPLLLIFLYCRNECIKDYQERYRLGRIKTVKIKRKKEKNNAVKPAKEIVHG